METDINRLFLLTVVFQGDITTLSGVYTFAFLGVMTLFSVGTILLKFKRPSLPREVTVSYGTTLFGIFCVSGEGKAIGFPSVYCCGGRVVRVYGDTVRGCFILSLWTIVSFI